MEPSGRKRAKRCGNCISVRAHVLLLVATMFTMLGVILVHWCGGSLGGRQALGLGMLALAPLVLVALKRQLVLGSILYWVLAAAMLVTYGLYGRGVRQLLMWFAASSLVFVEALGIVARSSELRGTRLDP